MPSFVSVVSGAVVQAQDIQQVIDALKGTASLGIPLSPTSVNDSVNFALAVKNQETTNSRALQVTRANNLVMIQADANGVVISPDGVAAASQVVVVAGTQTLSGAKTFSGGITAASLTLNGALNQTAGGSAFTGNMTISSGSLTVVGITNNAGLTQAGAINQTSGGSAFTGNMTIASGTLTVSAGVTTLNGTTNDSTAFSLIARNLAATTVLSARNDGTVNVCSSVGFLGFFGTGSPAVKATVTGAKGGNAALTSLMTALAGYGLVTDSTT